ncbi:alpha/beta hydrolase [Rothia sp. AR01]|uniref:Alpha/beta hydrolase n=1 Tax=Rothia santali TaxID=2949643 RepID=A0A9X2HGM3_9MICC|nr:alpha/beta fold hydrolase [Rothia santali]MCP3424488.1 alpha/beta hydrolase [Rothia santali]
MTASGAARPGPRAPLGHRAGPRRRVEDLELVDHRFRVPLTHGWAYGHGEPFDAAAAPGLAREEVELFACVVTDVGPRAPLPPGERPYLLYLQGGPGMGAPRPLSSSGWIAALAPHYRIVLMDQRGTGLSTPLSAEALRRRGGPEAQAAYLEHFRADSIVADAESIRLALTAGEPERRWATLGQSFGGFCTLSYLSFAPESLLHSWITAGLAPLTVPPREVYRATFQRMAERNAEFYGWYPEDVDAAARVAAHLEREDVRLPTGERLTPHRFQMAGQLLGGTGRVHGLHYLLESAFAEGPGRLSEGFLRDVSEIVSFAGRPLYALMHEAIYCDGPGVASGWAADAVRAERPDYEAARPLMFTGEMIHPWYFEEDPALIPLAETARLLAEKDDWGRLYDRGRLALNTVPVAASAYRHDVYVDHDLALATAASVAGLSAWTSETHHHDALGQDPDAVLGALGERLVSLGALAESPIAPREEPSQKVPRPFGPGRR